MRVIVFVFLLGCLAGCPRDGSSGDAGGTAGSRRSLPPGLVAPPGDGGAVQVHEQPTRGAASPRALAVALLKAAEKRSTDAFLELTVSGRDVGLFFHPYVQPALRVVLSRLPKKFALYSRQIGPRGSLAKFRPGLAVDFRRGHGARVKMPGLLYSKLSVKSGPMTRTFTIHRLVRVEGRWKILDL